jgi:hypothetical protein
MGSPLRNHYRSGFCENRVRPNLLDRRAFLLILNNAKEIEPQVNLGTAVGSN